jgi:uncharacterized membrane protein YfhO
MVVLSDVFFPGWRAGVDGHVTPIYEVNEAMRGVIVPKGEHTITMRYAPVSALAGGLLTLIGVGGAVVAAFGTRARRPARNGANQKARRQAESVPQVSHG